MIEVALICDRCGFCGEVAVNARGASTALRKALRQLGWRVRRAGKGQDLCPKCSTLSRIHSKTID